MKIGPPASTEPRGRRAGWGKPAGVTGDTTTNVSIFVLGSCFTDSLSLTMMSPFNPQSEAIFRQSQYPTAAYVRPWVSACCNRTRLALQACSGSRHMLAVVSCSAVSDRME